MSLFKLTGSRIRYFFVLCIIIVVLSACNDNFKPKYNVVIVTFDTTRADHIGSYNNETYTPALNNLAKDGIVYERALSTIPLTLPSHSSIMTGKVPFTHGVRDNGLFNLSDNQTTLAEILKDKGYNTAAAIGSFPLTSKFGINQGFDFFNEYITQNTEDMFGDGDPLKQKSHLFFDERKAAQVNEAIMPWIETHADSPFFVWFHYFDPHHPHEPPAPYNQEFVHDLYKGEIAYSDENLGKVIAQLKQLNLYDNTLIIFTSDHGEGRFEHNESTHSLLIYNSTLHVPLIIKYPNQQFANSRIKNWVSLVDVFPTVLTSLGIKLPDDIQGQLLPTTNSTNSQREIYSETLSPRFTRGWGEQRGLIKNGYKYIFGPLKELYNIDSDPHELNNIIDEKPELAKSMKNDLQNYLDEHQVSSPINSSINLDSGTLNMLRGLGYIQSSGNAIDHIIEELNDSGEAPQLHSGTNSNYSTAKDLLYQGRYIESIRYLDALLYDDPENMAYLELKIQAEINLGNYEVAKTLIYKLPIDTYGTLSPERKLQILAFISFSHGDLVNAKIQFEESEQIKMTLLGQNYLAKISYKENDLTAQQKHLKNILVINQTNIKALNELAISYSISGDIALTEDTFEQAIILNPFHQLSRYNYGVFLNSINDISAAQIQLKKAININPSYILAHYALIETYIVQGKKPLASEAYKILQILAPEHDLTKQAENLINNI